MLPILGKEKAFLNFKAFSIRDTENLRSRPFFAGAMASIAVSASWKFTFGENTKSSGWWILQFAITISSASTNSTGSNKSAIKLSAKNHISYKGFGILVLGNTTEQIMYENDNC